MSFLGGLGNFVQNIGPTAGAVAEAQAQGSGQRNQQALQMLALQRQQRSAEFENLKNAAEANKSNAEAGTYTPEYAGAKAGAEAGAQQPFKLTELQAQLDNRLTELKASGANEMQIALARIAGEKEIANAQIGAAASRQTNQQTFEQAQQGRQQQFQTGQQGREIQGHLQGIEQTQSGEVLPTLVHGVKDAWNSPINPVNWFGSQKPAPPSTSTAPHPAGITDVERQALKSQGYSDEQINSAYQVSP